MRELSVEILRSKKNNNRVLTTIQEVKDEVPNIQYKFDELNSEVLSAEAYSVMKSILAKPLVRAVVSYIQNKGTADVALLAHALSANDGRLLDDKIIIVTNDVGLTNAANDLGVDCISTETFRQI